MREGIKARRQDRCNSVAPVQRDIGLGPLESRRDVESILRAERTRGVENQGSGMNRNWHGWVNVKSNRSWLCPPVLTILQSGTYHPFRRSKSSRFQRHSCNAMQRHELDAAGIPSSWARRENGIELQKVSMTPVRKLDDRHNATDQFVPEPLTR